MFTAKADAVRRRMLGATGFWAYQWKELPLAAFAGLKIRSLDEQGCVVALPGGWRTQNPFRSTYFAAQSMAAEMSTGAPSMVFCRGSEASVSMLVTGLSMKFTKKIVGASTFAFADMAALAAAIDRAAATGEPVSFLARSVGRDERGDVASEFEITWSFKRRERT